MTVDKPISGNRRDISNLKYNNILQNLWCKFSVNA